MMYWHITIASNRHLSVPNKRCMYTYQVSQSVSGLQYTHIVHAGCKMKLTIKSMHTLCPEVTPIPQFLNFLGNQSVQPERGSRGRIALHKQENLLGWISSQKKQQVLKARSIEGLNFQWLIQKVLIILKRMTEPLWSWYWLPKTFWSCHAYIIFCMHKDTILSEVLGQILWLLYVTRTCVHLPIDNYL